MICEICNKEYKSIQPLSKHVTAYHKMSKQDYYDTYLKSPDEGICHEANCNNRTIFVGMDKGYNKYCCKSCQVRAQGNGKKIDHNKMWEIRHNTIENYELYNNCTHISKIVKLYGRDWFKLDIPIIKVSRMYQYVDNSYLDVISKFVYKHIKDKDKNKYKDKDVVNSNVKDKNINTTTINITTINTTTINKDNLSSLHCSFRTKNVKEKSKQTKLEKYGSETYNNPEKAKQTIEKLNRQFELDNNCTQIKKVVQQYGQGWLALKLPKLTRGHNANFISNEYLPIIQEYASKNHRGRNSKKECELYNIIKQNCKYEVLQNNRTVLPHFELDIYIPELKLAFEYNGVKWHSIENGMCKDYHLNKSLLCREKGIRLIHIYESENFKEQTKLAINLVNGIDNYVKNDFNKNNLINTIPEPEIVYQSKHYTVYGAGKLL